MQYRELLKFSPPHATQICQSVNLSIHMPFHPCQNIDLLRTQQLTLPHVPMVSMALICITWKRLRIYYSVKCVN